MRDSTRRRPPLACASPTAPRAEGRERHNWTTHGRVLAALLWFATATTTGAATAGEERAPETLTPNHFAHGHSLELRESRALQTLLLPIETYRGSVESRLADLRVFNAEGEAVPHALRELGAPDPQWETTKPLPLFSLTGTGERVGRHPSDDEIFWRGKGKYRVDAKISEEEATLHLEAYPPGAGQPQGTAGPAAKPTGYVVDTSGLERAVAGLELELAPSAARFVVPLRVEGTDDLVHFEELAGRAAIARLDQAGHRLALRSVEFRPTRHRYLKLSWPADPLPVEVLAVRGRLAPESPPLQRQHVRVTGEPIEGEARAFLFDLGGEVPIDRIQVELPRANTVVEARLYSGRTPEGPWVLRFGGLLYELEYQSPLRNPAIPWPVTRHRYCKLAISSKGGGLGSRPPVLDAAWRPEQLLFVTRGQPPFTLVYGRAGAPESGFDFEALLAATRTGADELPRESAALGHQRALADASVLEPPPKQLATRTIVLWVALFLAVALVVAMSIRLARELR